MNPESDPHPDGKNPYAPIENHEDVPVAVPVSAGQHWPVCYVASGSHVTRFVIPLVLGIGFLSWGIVMFLIHLFVIDGSQISFHLASTLPIIMGVFAVMGAWTNRDIVREVRLWKEGIEVVRTQSQTIAWDDIAAVRAVDSSNPGAIGQKVITLVGHDNEPVATINGVFKRTTALIDQIRSMAGISQATGGEPTTVSRAGKKKGRWTAVMTGFGALLLGAGGIVLPLSAYWDYEAAKLMESDAVEGKAIVAEKIVAPNGRTLRVRYDVTGENSTVESHNVEVTREFFDSVDQGSQVDIRYVPSRPDISELIHGEVKSDEFTDKPVVGLVMGILSFIAAAFLVVTTVLSWKGYDIDFKNGKFQIKPLG